MTETEPLGEFAWRVRIPSGVSARDALAALRAHPGVVDVVVTDSHAAVYLDDHASFDVESAFAAMTARAIRPDPASHIVRVRYDGLDLDEVATLAGITRDEVIALHARAQYTVAFVGFMPGFAYLDGLDPSLVLPRRPSPRTRVDAGSVAIAGARTGVYPFASPGGWHLLGHAVDFEPFDTAKGARLLPGDHVRFERVP